MGSHNIGCATLADEAPAKGAASGLGDVVIGLEGNFTRRHGEPHRSVSRLLSVL